MNLNLKYEAVEVEGTNISLEFSKTVQEEKVSVNAKVKNGDKDAGMIGYSEKDGYLICQLKPMDESMRANVKRIMGTIGECLSDIGL